MRLIAERLLPADHEAVRDVEQPPPLTLPSPRNGRQYHVYCSKSNPGAAALMEEVAKAQAIEIKSTSSGGVEECEQMLVYLTAETWTGGERSVRLAAEVKDAMSRGVPLLLAHEMPGVGQEGRHPAEFGAFFKSHTTPAELVRAGIYHKVATALKGGAWRAVSTAMVAQALVKASGEHHELAHFPSSTAQPEAVLGLAPAPVEVAPVEVAPVEVAPIEAAPTELSDVHLAEQRAAESAQEKIRQLEMQLKQKDEEIEQLTRQIVMMF